MSAHSPRAHTPRGVREQREAPRDRRRRELARLGEEYAASHLQRLGFAVLERNARTREGEIDLIAFDGRVLAFVEVKTRRVRAASQIRPEHDPLSALRPRECARIRRLAAARLAEPDRTLPRARELRFDAIGIILDVSGRLVRLEHLEAAF